MSADARQVLDDERDSARHEALLLVEQRDEARHLLAMTREQLGEARAVIVRYAGDGIGPELARHFLERWPPS